MHHQTTQEYVGYVINNHWDIHIHHRTDSQCELMTLDPGAKDSFLSWMISQPIIELTDTPIMINRFRLSTAQISEIEHHWLTLIDCRRQLTLTFQSDFFVDCTLSRLIQWLFGWFQINADDLLTVQWARGSIPDFPIVKINSIDQLWQHMTLTHDFQQRWARSAYTHTPIGLVSDDPDTIFSVRQWSGSHLTQSGARARSISEACERFGWVTWILQSAISWARIPESLTSVFDIQTNQTTKLTSLTDLKTHNTHVIPAYLVGIRQAKDCQTHSLGSTWMASHLTREQAILSGLEERIEKDCALIARLSQRWWHRLVDIAYDELQDIKQTSSLDGISRHHYALELDHPLPVIITQMSRGQQHVFSMSSGAQVKDAVIKGVVQMTKMAHVFDLGTPNHIKSGDINGMYYLDPAHAHELMRLASVTEISATEYQQQFDPTRYDIGKLIHHRPQYEWYVSDFDHPWLTCNDRVVSRVLCSGLLPYRNGHESWKQRLNHPRLQPFGITQQILEARYLHPYT